MDFLLILKLIGGVGGGLLLLVAGLFGVSKWRNSKLNSMFEALTTTILSDKDKLHQIDVTNAKSEQKKIDVQAQVDAVDKQIEKVENTPSKPATNDAVIDMFDKLSKK